MKSIIFYLLMMILSVKTISQQIDYTEKHRPQFHFSPPAHWMNDPNGMVYYKGEYHLFYQYYPDSTVWGPMHWGHAVSKDLIHWEHLPIALYPDSIGYIFSGSVVVDENNTSGFQQGDEKTLVAIFTYHNMNGERSGANNFQSQGIAYSNDKGRTWKKFAGNPVLKNSGNKDFRDPKVCWYAPSQQWIMTLAVGNKIQFYHSENLKNWEFSSEFGSNEGSHGGVWECPDLFPLQIENSKETKWVLIVSIGSGAPNGGSGTQYFTGNFDGTTFKNDSNPQTALWVDYGCDNYAGVTWSNTNNRRIFLGWMSNWQYAQLVPTKTWRSAMTLPREFFLQKTAEGIRLISKPVKETEALRIAEKKTDFSNEIKMQSPLSETELIFDLEKIPENDFGIEIFNTKNENVKIGFDKTKNQFYIDRTNAGENNFSKIFAAKAFAPRILTNKIIKLHLFLDNASAELFADDGTIIITEIFFPSADFTNMQLYPKNVSLISSHVYALKSIWSLKNE
jgi:fructan beta-fructosidase